MNNDFIDYFSLKSNKKKLIDIKTIRVVFGLIEIDFIFFNSKIIWKTVPCGYDPSVSHRNGMAKTVLLLDLKDSLRSLYELTLTPV